MTAQHLKDVVLFSLSAIEMRQVMEERSMVHAVGLRVALDLADAARDSRWIQDDSPIRIFHEEQGRGHVLHCHVHLWPYFREVDAGNPLEREIRSELLSLGLSGEADRRIARYSPAALSHP